MKKVISILLAVVCILNMMVVNSFAAGELYKEINVEYSDNKGNIETLNVMVKDNNVYVDAFQLGERLGYKVRLIEDDSAVVVVSQEDKNSPRLLAIFYFDSVKVNYLVHNRTIEYEAPFCSLHNSQGTWIPLQYALFALNSSMLIIGDIVTILMPQKTLLQTIVDVSKNMDYIQFEYQDDMYFSNSDMYIKTGASRIVNLFSGILKFESESWFLMVQQFVGDTSAYDNKYGDEFSKLFSTNSDKELKALNEQVKLVTDVLSTDGTLATALGQIKTDIDIDVDELYKQCNKFFKNIESSNTDLAKYNATYEKLEEAFNKQTVFSNTGEVAMDVQGKLDSATKTLNVLGTVLEVTGYISEYAEKDDYSLEALSGYLNEFSDSTKLTESFQNTLKANISAFKSDVATYSVAKYIENNYADWIQSGLNVGQQIGSQANLILLAWNIASATIPFIKNGLDSADNFELSLYSYILQHDSFGNYVKYREDVLSNDDLLTTENCYKIAQYLYTYLKSAYITRDAALGSFANLKNDPEYKDVFEELGEPNNLIADYLASVKMISKDNLDGSMGFLPERSEMVTREYSDEALLKLLLESTGNTATSEKSESYIRETSDERDIVLVLDASGSMAGEPMEETKDAATKFVQTILKEDASIGIVTYDDEASMPSDFSTNESSLVDTIDDIDDGGGTNIEAGLKTADQMLSSSNAKKKIIVLMSDGMPNNGLEGDELIAYSDELKEKGIYIYTLGFFNEITDKSFAQYLMEGIASEGCHYEVSDAESLVFFFGDIADQINGQKYIYVRIACPVDVKVSYDGETLDSSESGLSTRTNFGTLTFEDTAEYESYDYYDEESTDSTVKILRLKEGVPYDISIHGTGRGRMNYSIGFMDENGEYSDFRRFSNIRINNRTSIDTIAEVSDSTMLKVDEDGDGKYDVRYKAKANEYGKEVNYTFIIYTVLSLVTVLLLLIFVLVVYKKVKNRRKYNG